MTRSLLILYGSETGNAQDCAETVFRIARRLGCDARLSAMDRYPFIRIVDENLVVFVASTTGQGAVPANMKAPCSSTILILEILVLVAPQQPPRRPAACLEIRHLWPRRLQLYKLEQRLSQLGAQSILPRGEGDDQHPHGLAVFDHSDSRVDGGFVPWLDKLKAFIHPDTPIPDALPPDAILPPIHSISVHSDSIMGLHSDSIMGLQSDSIMGLHSDSIMGLHSLDSHSMEGSIPVVVVQNMRITAKDHWQDVRHIIFKSHPLDFDPGDVAVIYPLNPPPDVSLFCQLQRYNATTMVSVSSYPHPIPLHHLIACHLDIHSIPRRSFFNLASYFTTNPTHQQKLVQLSSPENSDDLYDYTSRPRRTILEVLADFPDIRIPLEYLLDVIPPLHPRHFSIANSTEKTEIHLAAAIVRYKTILWKERWGVCSRYLDSLIIGTCHTTRLTLGTTISIDIEKSWVKLPDSKTPMVLIGPGTGIAPMRSLIQSRSQNPAAETILFFGCRNKEKDFLFRDEWKYHNVVLFPAFSRDQKNKEYVQHVITRQHQLIRDIVRRGAWEFGENATGRSSLSVGYSRAC
ncbi:NADPH-dependent diflavin oxidoreductase 1 [Neolecta irregularis DAH-3]|uniref:NADPH-dependent diflavin oxidoreductase 1 n=1 Tax=Neolecta irregularis (strain DAH-3) TaxID=1198029 RepID=A0A1U7LTP9_NEOID|nr:NADPH-dependent diflavin oxidoreductase 1 [Neolecta irregularis DAH-3]|eukprot:OLL25891.1 NADPH-dependent diflavin oxidoreductase 1 [Neolecta irregularis DAH-3]